MSQEPEVRDVGTVYVHIRRYWVAEGKMVAGECRIDGQAYTAMYARTIPQALANLGDVLWNHGFRGRLELADQH